MNEACSLDFGSLTEEEIRYLAFRFSETVKSLAFMTIEQNARIAITRLSGRTIKGGDRVNIIFDWGVMGNDFLMWLGEFRRKKEEKEIWS